MNRRIIVIILGAVLLALFVGLVWFWFFRGGSGIGGQGGSFGSGQDRSASTTQQGGSGSGGSFAVGQGSAGGSGTAGGPGQGGSAGSAATGGGLIQIAGSGVGPRPNDVYATGYSEVDGVTWLGNTGGNTVSGGGPVTTFVPSTINQLNSGGVGGSVGFIGSFGGDDGTSDRDIGIAVGGIFGAGAGCVAIFASSFFSNGFAAGVSEAGTANLSSILGDSILGVSPVLTYDFRAATQRSQNQFKDVQDCITRTIAKAVLQQMTASIVNWINSGFEGKPSFVTNYRQFFTNVGDVAAGEFIKGSGLAFLCSPFQAQIRIALAQSYARRNAPSCTLTGVIDNITGFMNGDFAQGGWAGLIQFTSIPTNNPFGAFMYAQAGLAAAQSSAIADARNNISAGGFIGLQKEVNCRPVRSDDPNDSTVEKICDKQIVTPGAVIEQSLETALGTSYRQLELAKSFDEIISALITQLINKTLYEGLSSLSGGGSGGGYENNYLTPAQVQAQQEGQLMLVDMQGRLRFAQQYGAVQQGSIGDIQAAQQQLQAVVNCWEVASSSLSADQPDRAAQAGANAQTALGALVALNTQVSAHNDNITRTNDSIAKLQDLQTKLIAARSAQDVAAVKASYNALLPTVPSEADITQAQQDRTTLQQTLATRNAQTAQELQQCHAF